MAIEPLKLTATFGFFLHCAIAGASEPSCLTSDKLPSGESLDANILWQGTSLTYTTLVRCAAPILWFSPDEPLLTTDGPPVPEQFADLVGQHPRPQRTVYFRIEKVQSEGRLFRPFASERRPNVPSESVDLSLLDERGFLLVYLRYYFYYGQDIGVGGHDEDLESARIILILAQWPKGGDPKNYVAALVQVEAFAHGLRWFNNRLSLAPLTPEELLSVQFASDVLLPVTLLVEEGKHATCPDRNGDGFFNLGYDVNVFTNDAWGVRDTFGAGSYGLRYESTMTKPRWLRRRAGDKVFPPLSRDDFLRLRYEQAHHWEEASYVLLPICSESEQCHLCLDATRCGLNKVPDEGWLRGVATAWPLSYRYDGAPALSVAFPLVPLRAVHHWIGFHGFAGEARLAYSLAISPSVSRMRDWYVAVGLEDVAVGASGGRRFGYEFGVRVRWKPVWLKDRMPLVGARVGFRSDSRTAFRRGRFVFEFGGGLF